MPLGAHHKLLGRWAAGHEEPGRTYTRLEAQRRIEQQFDSAVQAILKPIDIADLRVVALHGHSGMSPALAIICDSVGQVELGWIERTEALKDALVHGVPAPVAWRAAAYQALEQTLWAALPVFSYVDLVEEMSNYYWDGETEDEGARNALLEWHGADPDDITEMLPSTMHAKRPDWMKRKAVSLKRLPARLRHRITAVRDAHKALRDFGKDANAWGYDSDELFAYIPDVYDSSTIPPMTLVPADHFGRELDDIGRHGMEGGFADTAGLCALSDTDRLEEWFVSLKLGVDFLVATQDLINFDPRDL